MFIIIHATQDGKVYVHCQWCQKCVKGGERTSCPYLYTKCNVYCIGYVHCSSCSTCLPANHVCHSIVTRYRCLFICKFILLYIPLYCFSGCHICGSTSHKRRDCPKKCLKEITRYATSGIYCVSYIVVL